MNELLLAMVLGNKGFDRARFASYLRDERARKEKDYAKIARALAFGAYYLWGGMKLNAQTTTGTVPASDPGVSNSGKLDAVLAGITELYKSFPWFGLVNEAATFVGEVIARSTSMDPALIELLGSASPPAGQTITLNTPMQNPALQTMGGRVMRVTAPSGQTSTLRIGAQGISVDDPNWSIAID